MKWKEEAGDWTRFRELPSVIEVDFHWSESGDARQPYEEKMAEVYDRALAGRGKRRVSGDLSCGIWILGLC